ncbi:MAG: hypothetical protein R3A52_10545 [Polyangiales bacterium]
MLWAWERPEDLRAIPDGVGVAFLRATVDVSDRGVRVSPRRQPLRVREGAFVMPVVRVEVTRGHRELTSIERSRVVAELVRAANGSRHRAVQIDLDAPRSLRGSYALLLREARAALGPRVWLSMTALASWCEGDRWLEAERPPVDEVVPMVFDMGTDSRAVLDALRSRGMFLSTVCRGSVGWGEGQPTVLLQGVRRRYVYNRRAWTPDAITRWARW